MATAGVAGTGRGGAGEVPATESPSGSRESEEGESDAARVVWSNQTRFGRFDQLESDQPGPHVRSLFN